MRLLFLCLMIPLLLGASQANIITMLKATAKKEGIPAEHLIGICGAETRWNPKKTGDKRERIRSHGLCQIQTRVARDRGFKGHVAKLYKARINARYSAKQIRWCMDRVKPRDWGSDIGYIYACYNRGADWVDENYYKALDIGYINEVNKCKNRKTCRREAD